MMQYEDVPNFPIEHHSDEEESRDPTSQDFILPVSPSWSDDVSEWDDTKAELLFGSESPTVYASTLHGAEAFNQSPLSKPDSGRNTPTRPPRDASNATSNHVRHVSSSTLTLKNGIVGGFLILLLSLAAYATLIRPTNSSKPSTEDAMRNLAPLINIAQSIKVRAANSSIAAIELEQGAKSIVKTRLVPSMATLRAEDWGWEADVMDVLLHNPLAAELPAQTWSYHLEQAAVKSMGITQYTRDRIQEATINESIFHYPYYALCLLQKLLRGTVGQAEAQLLWLEMLMKHHAFVRKQMNLSTVSATWPWSGHDPVADQLLDIVDIVERWGDRAYVHVLAKKQWAEALLRELDSKKSIKGGLPKPSISDTRIQEALQAFEGGLRQWTYKKTEAHTPEEGI